MKPNAFMYGYGDQGITCFTREEGAQRKHEHLKLALRGTVREQQTSLGQVGGNCLITLITDNIFHTS